MKQSHHSLRTDKLFYLILLVLIILSCSGSFAKDQNKLSDRTRKRIVSFRCDSVMTEYNLLSPCDKIAFLEKQYALGLTSDCLERMLKDIIELTHVDANITLGPAGTMYKNDSLFKADVKKWKKKMNCSNKKNNKKG